MTGFKYLITALALTIFVPLGGCRMNGGDIGALYGIWLLTEMEVDGEKYDKWNANGFETFFEFENDICQVIRANERYDVESKWSTFKWIKEDTEMQLDFTHTDNTYPEPGGYLYAAPSWLLLTEPTTYDFTVEWRGSKQMTWRTVNTSGQQLTYYFRKEY